MIKQRKHVLITGSAGFLGRNTSLHFAQLGFEVSGFDISEFSDHNNWGIKNFYSGKCDLESLIKISEKHGSPQIIIHAAGSGSVHHSIQDPRADFYANVLTSLEVLDFCRMNPDTRLVIPSSAAVYGNSKTLPISEDHELNPVSPYGVHKKVIEDLAKSYSENFQVKVALVRFFSLYGCGLKKQIFWDACVKASNNNFSFAGGGNEMRDFLHVTDAARLMAQVALDSNQKFSIVNGGTGTGTTIRDAMTILGKCWIPSLVPEFTGASREGDPVHFIADIKNLSSIGFSPSLRLEDEIPKYVEWFKNERPQL